MKSKLILLAASVVTPLLLANCTSTKPKPETKSAEAAVDVGYVSAQEDTFKVKEANVFDAGVYREKEDYEDIVRHGGKSGAVIPTEKFYSSDREKKAPVGKIFYVLTEDNPAHCIKGKYVMVEGRKQLVVFTKSPMPSNYCIYQRSFSSEAEGFSIYVDEGGICKPSYSSVKHDDKDRRVASVESVNNTVSMGYCVENTVSYGEELSRRKH